MVKRLTTAHTAEEENSYRSYVEYTLIGLFGDIPKYHSFLSSAGFTNQSGNDIISKKKKKKTLFRRPPCASCHHKYMNDGGLIHFLPVYAAYWQ